MRIGAVADLHGVLPEVPACDLLLVAGDICPTADHDVAYQARWLDTEFRAWLEDVPAGTVAGIAGNHDFVFERAPEDVPGDLRWTYLEDAATTVGGVTVWGSPWTPWFGGWAYNAPRRAGEVFLADRYAAVPDDVDVLMLHGPPRGYGDALASNGRKVGSTAALDLVDRVRPRLCVYGHIHEGRGRWVRGATTLWNCSALTLEYAPVDDPVMLVDL